MIIDFHVHIFPEKMAERTVKMLAGRAGLLPFTDGTLIFLKRSMKDAGVDFCVTLPIATKPEQTPSINNFAISLLGEDGIIPFGSVHPRFAGWRGELDRLKAAGIKGIKLHPDYQDFFVDSPEVFPILEHAAKIGLVVVLHAGVDIGLPEPVHCTPERMARVLDRLGCGKFVLAHTGGYLCWEEVFENLAGRDVYFDTSFTLGKIDNDLFLRILKKHKKMLFATDSPWGGQKDEIEKIKNLGLDEETERAVFSENAKELLGI